MDQLYVEEGYVDSAYFEIIVNSGVIGLTPFFAEGYVDDDYIQNRGSAFSIVINTDGEIVEANGSFAVSSNTTIAVNRIIEGAADFAGAMTASMTAIAFKNHDAALDSAFIQNTDVNFIADAGGLLEYFAELDAQAARFRSSVADFSAIFFTSNNSGELGTDIDANVIVDAASILTSAATISVDAEKFTYIQTDAQLIAQFSVDANAIEYITRPNTFNRPINLIKNASDSFVTSPVKYGSHSLKVTDNGGSSTELSTAFGIDTTEDFVAEGWFYINDTDALQVASGTKLFSIGYGENAINTFNELFPITRRGFSVGLSPIDNNQRTFVIRYRNGGGWVNAVTTQVQPNSNVWFHLAVVRENGVLKLLYNNSLIFSNSYNVGWTIDNDYNRIYFEHNYNVNPNDNVFYDAFRFAKGTSAITGLSQEPVDTEQTVVLYNFNNTTDDGYVRAITFSAQANLAAQTTAITNADLSADANANLAATSSLNALIGKITQATSDFDAVASQLTAAAKVADFFVNADVAANLAIQGDLFKNYIVELNSTANQNTVAVKTVDAVIDITSAFTPVIETDGFKNFAADITANSSIVAEVNRIQQGQSSIESQITIVVDGVSIIDSNAVLNSEFAQTTAANRFRDIDALLSVEGAQLSAISKIAGFFVNADVSATLTASGASTAGAFVDPLNSVAQINVAVDRIRNSSVDILSEFNQNADGVLVTDSNANLNADFAQTTTAQRSRDVVTDFESIATQLTAVGKIAPYTAGLDSVATMSVTGNTITDSAADITSAAAAITTATRIKPLAAAISSVTTASAIATEITGFDADLGMSATVSATGIIKVFNLEQYYYTIPREARTHTVSRETRSHRVTKETRIYTIKGT